MRASSSRPNVTMVSPPPPAGGWRRAVWRSASGVRRRRRVSPRRLRLDSREKVRAESPDVFAVVVDGHDVPAALEHVRLDHVRGEPAAEELDVRERGAVITAAVEDERGLRHAA